MSNYSKQLCRHLTNYKIGRLGVRESGTYNHRGRTLTYGHILPRELEWLNIIEPFRREVRNFAKTRQIKLHKYFHHLNSSQAFAFNLFFPYFEVSNGQSNPLLRALGQKGRIAEWSAEFVAALDEGTNVDVAWSAGESGRTYCEVKLTEQEFGVASGSRGHRRKLVEIYGPVLREYCTEDLMEFTRFCKHFQILHNVWLIARDEASRLIFLMPQQNRELWDQLESCLGCVKLALRRRISVHAIEDVVTFLESQDELGWYANLLAEKYVLNSVNPHSLHQ